MNRLRTFSEHPTAFWFRHFALALAVLACLMTPFELIFAKHYTQATMLIPFGLVALSLLCIAAIAFDPSPLRLRLFQAVMLLLFVGSSLGVFFHLKGNLEVALEVDPTLRGLPLIWEVLTGAAPALAPGLLAQVGLLGLAYTYRHPVLLLHKSLRLTRPLIE